MMIIVKIVLAGLFVVGSLALAFALGWRCAKWESAMEDEKQQSAAGERKENP